MNYYLQGFLLLALSVSAPGAEEEAPPVRRSRRPIPYDRAVEFHDFKPSVAVPEDEQDAEERPAFSLESLLPGLYGHNVVVDPGFSLDHTLTPPSMPAAPETDGAREDWLVPLVERALRGGEEEARPESSGWGWLADHAAALRREQAAATETDQREDEEELEAVEATGGGDELVLPEVLRPQTSVFDQGEAVPTTGAGAADQAAWRAEGAATRDVEELTREEWAALVTARAQPDARDDPMVRSEDAAWQPDRAYREVLESPFGRGGVDADGAYGSMWQPDFSFRDTVAVVDEGFEGSDGSWFADTKGTPAGGFDALSSTPLGGGFVPVDMPQAGWDGGWSGADESGGIGFDTREERPINRVVTPTHSDDWLSTDPGW